MRTSGSTRLFTAVLVGLVAASAPLRAQQNASAEERIAKMESIVSKLPKISGLVNVRYRYDGTDHSNGFDVRRARLDFRGGVTRDLDYRLHLELANSPKILDAYLQWRVHECAALQLGQYKIPFSLENPYSPADLETVENSLVITQLVNYTDVSGLSANGRDIGLSLSGKLFAREGFSLVSYSLGIFNGQGIGGSDKNKRKDLSGIVTLTPFRELTLAVSHYNGSTVQAAGELKRVRTGVGARYDDGKLLVRSEYIRGRTAELKSEGAYATAAYRLHPKVQAVAKYDYFKRDLSDSHTRQQRYTVGANYLPVKNIVLQLNYMRNELYESGNNFLVAQVFVKF